MPNLPDTITEPDYQSFHVHWESEPLDDEPDCCRFYLVLRCDRCATDQPLPDKTSVHDLADVIRRHWKANHA